MLLRRRILLVGSAAAIAAIGIQPVAATAGTLSCDPFIHWETNAWVFQFGCEDMVGCYSYQGSYQTFDCWTNTPGGLGCDIDGCFSGL